MKPSKIYASEPIEKTQQIHHLEYFIPEVDVKNIKSQNRITILTHFNPYIDCEFRVCIIQSAWYDLCPVMITRRAGRGGKDQRDRFITDQYRYAQMVQYLQSLVEEENEITDLYAIDKDIESLDQFYNYFIKEEYLGPIYHKKLAFAKLLENYGNDYYCFGKTNRMSFYDRIQQQVEELIDINNELVQCVKNTKFEDFNDEKIDKLLGILWKPTVKITSMPIPVGFLRAGEELMKKRLKEENDE